MTARSVNRPGREEARRRIERLRREVDAEEGPCGRTETRSSIGTRFPSARLPSPSACSGTGPPARSPTPSRLAAAGILLMVMATGGSVLGAETGLPPEAGPSPSQPPMTAAPALGRFHVWLKAGRSDLAEGAREWGIDRIAYLALEGFLADGRDDYYGLELGRFDRTEATSADGDALRDIDSYWLEMNGKHVFGLPHGLSFDVGAGGALFYIDGEEVTTLGGQEFTDPLADIGYGVQVFGDFTWRAHRLLVGVDVKYQWAFDLLAIDYSNLRMGAHLGMTF